MRSVICGGSSVNWWLKRLLIGLGSVVFLLTVLFLGFFVYANRTYNTSLQEFAVVMQETWFPSPPKQAAPWPTPAATRDGRWEQDIDYLAEELPRLHVNAYHAISKSAFNNMVTDLKANVPALQDAQIEAGIMRLVASVGDGHTSVRDALGGFRTYPLELRWLEDGLYVVGAQEEARRALGSKLVRIGDTDLEEAYERTSVYLAYENEWNKKANSEELLPKAELLYASGVLPSLEGGDFTFVDGGDTFTLTLEPSETWGGWESVQHDIPFTSNAHR